VPYSLLAVATLATLSLPLGLRALASPLSPNSGPSPAASGAGAPAGPLAHTARAGTSTSVSDSVRVAGPAVVWTGPVVGWVALSPAVATRALAGTPFATLAAAGNAASTWSFPAPGTTGPVRQGDLCITLPAGPAGTTVTTNVCDGSPAQQITLVTAHNGQAMQSAAGILVDDFRQQSNTFQTNTVDRGDGIQVDLLSPVGQRDLAVSMVTAGEVGIATISGTGTPGAAVLHGDQGVTIAGDGTWTMTVAGVAAAGDTLRFAQSINGSLYTHADAVVPAWPTPPEPPTAAVSFPDDVAENAIVHGDGVDGATITIRLDTGTIATTTVSAGVWSIDIAALGSGSHDVTVTQKIADLESQPQTLTIDYGPAVSITSPTDEATAPAVS
jgi:hypothetical protein